MSDDASPVYRFGDLLALARESWVREMERQLESAGHPDYRRSDAAVVRLLARGPRSVRRIGDALGVSRQAARKLVSGLERRGYAHTARGSDARQLEVSLTPRGEAFARAIGDAVQTLNGRVAESVDATQLRAADAVLRATLADRQASERAARLVPPPPA